MRRSCPRSRPEKVQAQKRTRPESWVTACTVTGPLSPAFVMLNHPASFITLNSTMNRRALPVLFMLLSAALCFGRNASEDAPAIKAARRMRESLPDPAGLQISRAVIAGKAVCIDYRSRNASGGITTGFAVYKTDKDLVWLDNSWIWDQACLTGKYGQRRQGKDATRAAAAALRDNQPTDASVQQAVSASVAPAAVPAARSTNSPAQVETIALTVKTPVAPPKVAPSSPLPVAPRPAPRTTPDTVAGTATAVIQDATAAPLPVPISTAPAAQPTAPIARVEAATTTTSVAAVTSVSSAPPVQTSPTPLPNGPSASSVPIEPVGVASVAAISTAPPAPKPVAISTPTPAQAPTPIARAEVVVEVTPPPPASAAPVQQSAAVAQGQRAAPPPRAKPPAVVAAAPASASSSYAYSVSGAPLASVQLGTIRGVTIVDNQGALERQGPPAVPESLGDAARRLRQAKQQ
jgi:hypothetical protein